MKRMWSVPRVLVVALPCLLAGRSLLGMGGWVPYPPLPLVHGFTGTARCTRPSTRVWNQPPIPRTVATSSTTTTATVTTTATTTTPPPPVSLWVFQRLDSLYTEASRTIKCPFFRRRAADAIDHMAMLAKFLVVRHKSLWSLVGIEDVPMDGNVHGRMEAPGCRAVGKFIEVDEQGRSIKHRHLPMETIRQTIVNDWKSHGRSGSSIHDNHKGYYITGKLNSTIYRDDCLFTGPDPDMPVRGLRKYLGAASHLFFPQESTATLTGVEFLDVNGDLSVDSSSSSAVRVQWRLQGVLRLPWKPRVPPWSGWTTYHVDETDGLIWHHDEGWDISVWQAFTRTVLPPAVGDQLWGTSTTATTTTTTTTITATNGST